MWTSRRWKLCLLVVFTSTLTTTSCQTTQEPDDDPTTEATPEVVTTSAMSLLEEVITECGDNVSCAKDRLARLTDDLDKLESVILVPGLATIERTSPSNNSEVHDNSSRLETYLRTHCVQVQLSQAAGKIVSRALKDTDPQLGVDVITSRDNGQGRGRIRKLVLPLLLLLNIKSLVVVPVFLTAVMLVAFKGLWAGLAAFIVSGAVGLRQLFKNGEDTGPSTRFSVGVIKPHIVPDVYHHGHDYWHGWSRSGPPLPPPTHEAAYPYRGYYPPPSSAAWGDRPLVS